MLEMTPLCYTYWSQGGIPLPETDIATGNWWLEDYPFGKPIFKGYVSLGSVYIGRTDGALMH